MLTPDPAPPTRPALYAEHRIGRLARLRCWAHDGAPTPPAGPAAHAAVEIAWVDSGAVDYGIGARRVGAMADAVVVIPLGAAHTTAFRGRVRAGALWVAGDVVNELGAALGHPGAARALQPGPLTGSGAAEVPVLARMLSAELAAGAPGALLAADALLEAIVIRVLRAAPLDGRCGGARSPCIIAAVDLVQTRYADPLGVDDLAGAAGMSRFHFSRIFRREVGSSPYRYLTGVRLERAAELLRAGRHDVTQAALEVGFADLGRFARAFRARFGCPPSALSRRARHRAPRAGAMHAAIMSPCCASLGAASWPSTAGSAGLRQPTGTSEGGRGVSARVPLKQE